MVESLVSWTRRDSEDFVLILVLYLQNEETAVKIK